jgi:hypothetical protein
MSAIVVFQVLGILMICLGQGLGSPIVKEVQGKVSAAQLMIVRGGLTVALAGVAMVLAQTGLSLPNQWVFYCAVSFALANFFLYKAFQAWRIAPTIIMIGATPVVNFLIDLALHRQVSVPAIGSLSVLLAGTALALKPEKRKEFNRYWILFSTSGVACNGLFYEFLHKAQSLDQNLDFVHVLSQALPICFWQAVAVTWLGFLFSAVSRDFWSPIFDDRRLQGKLLWFASLVGAFYFLGNIITFKYFSLEWGSVFAQLEVLGVIIIVRIIRGTEEALTARQVTGTIIGVGGPIIIKWFIS